MPAAGRLRHRVTLTTPTRTRDALGGVSEAAGATVTVWASFEPVGNGERFDAAQFQSRPTHRCTIRHRAGVSRRDSLTFQGRVFDIVELRDPSDRQDGQLLEMLCAARQPGAQT